MAQIKETAQTPIVKGLIERLVEGLVKGLLGGI